MRVEKGSEMTLNKEITTHPQQKSIFLASYLQLHIPEMVILINVPK